MAETTTVTETHPRTWSNGENAIIIVLLIGGVLFDGALLLGAGLFYRALCQQQRAARQLAIQTHTGIEQGQLVQIGSRAQWIHIGSTFH
jgi:hypothetical protein